MKPFNTSQIAQHAEHLLNRMSILKTEEQALKRRQMRLSLLFQFHKHGVAQCTLADWFKI
jgi:hypothetical protein